MLPSLNHACRLVQYFYLLGFIAVQATTVLPIIAATSLACTLVESFPATLIDDNISVPAVAAGLSLALSVA
jgi:dolichol kinase